MGEEDLGDIFFVSGEGLFIGLHQTRLADGGQGLFFRQTHFAVGDKTYFPFAGGYSPGGNENDLAAAAVQETDLLGKVSDDFAVYAVFIGEDSAADLDNNPLGLVKQGLTIV